MNKALIFCIEIIIVLLYRSIRLGHENAFIVKESAFSSAEEGLHINWAAYQLGADSFLGETGMAGEAQE